MTVLCGARGRKTDFSTEKQGRNGASTGRKGDVLPKKLISPPAKTGAGTEISLRQMSPLVTEPERFRNLSGLDKREEGGQNKRRSRDGFDSRAADRFCCSAHSYLKLHTRTKNEHRCYRSGLWESAPAGREHAPDWAPLAEQLRGCTGRRE